MSPAVYHYNLIFFKQCLMPRSVGNLLVLFMLSKSLIHNKIFRLFSIFTSLDTFQLNRAVKSQENYFNDHANICAIIKINNYILVAGRLLLVRSFKKGYLKWKASKHVWIVSSASLNAKSYLVRFFKFPLIFFFRYLRFFEIIKKQLDDLYRRLMIIETFSKSSK